jgi:general nucleoside transport system permease protein
MHKLFSDMVLPAGAIVTALLLFGLLVWFAGVNPLDVWVTLFKGAFGDWYSWQNTLQRAAPLMLTALCVAIPARAGLVVIGGEGAVVLGGLACAALPYLAPLPASLAGTVLVCLAGRGASTGVSMRPSAACCWHMWPSDFSNTWWKARCEIPAA